MLPLTLLACRKVYELLTGDSALARKLAVLSSSNGIDLPPVDSSHVYLSSATNDVGDTETRLGYPRICIYSSGFKNSQFEKFRSFSGAVTTTLDIWSSANMVEATDRSIHYYVEGVSDLIRNSSGDWGDGVFSSGVYDVQFQSPKAGGLGFVQLARIKFDLVASQD